MILSLRNKKENVGNTLGFYDFFKSIFFQTILVSKDVEFNGKLHDT